MNEIVLGPEHYIRQADITRKHQAGIARARGGFGRRLIIANKTHMDVTIYKLEGTPVKGSGYTQLRRTVHCIYIYGYGLQPCLCTNRIRVF